MNFLALVYTKMFKKSREEVYSMNNDKKRGGVRKGAGRKSTGRERDKTISFKVTDEEREKIYKTFDFKETLGFKEKGRVEVLLDIMRIHRLGDFDINLEDGRLFSIETYQGRDYFTENRTLLYFLDMKIVEWKGGKRTEKFGGTSATSNEFIKEYFKNTAFEFLTDKFKINLPEEYPEIKPQIEKYIEELSKVLDNYQKLVEEYPDVEK
jgi:transcriptional regulator, MarR family